MAIVVTMCKLWLSILIGFYANKKGMFTKETTARVTSLIVQVTSPLLIIYSISSVGSGSENEVLQAVLFGVAIYIGSAIIGAIIMKFWKVEPDCKGIYQLMMIFSNCNFMGIPVVESLIGPEAVFLIVIMNLPFNLLFYTYGVYLILKDKGESSTIHLRDIITPGAIASALALILYFTGISLPEFINEPAGFIGNLTPALSMICIGSSMAGYSLKNIFRNKDLYILSCIRLIVLPLLAYFALRATIGNGLVTQVATLSVGMPIAAMTAMGASEYGGNTEAASGGIAMSTLFSMITLPITAILLGI